MKAASVVSAASTPGGAATSPSPPVVTCRKMKPAVDRSLWCRSCAMNLKKRCGGLHATYNGGPDVIAPLRAPAAAASDAAKRLYGEVSHAVAGRKKGRYSPSASGKAWLDDDGGGGVTPPGLVTPASTPGHEEKWVQCEGCKAWRQLPGDEDLAALPDLW